MTRDADLSTEFLYLAARRADQLFLRLVLAACIGAAAFFLDPRPLVLLWLPLVFITQTFEHFAIDRVVIARGGAASRALRAAVIAVTFINTTIYVGLSVVIWSAGAAGQMFATMLICGTLLHVCLHLYRVDLAQIAAGAPPVLLLLGLPLGSYLAHGGRAAAAITALVLSAGLYLAHLFVGVAESARTHASVLAATAEAEAQRRRAEAESRAKSDFLATISHEIRTPLNAVTSTATLLRGTRLTERQAEYVSILLDGSEVLLSLISQVLDMSKIEAGKMSLDVGDTRLADLARRIGDLLRAPAESKGLALRIRLEPDLPEMIRTDGLRLSQILFNLVSNAVKFTDAGEVSLAVSRTRGPDGSDRLAFEVADTGPGIPPEDQARLFSSFEQADAGVTRRYGGTGLGLAISRKLSELMDGRLTLDSAPGQGCVFRLELPLVAAAEPATSAAPALASPAASAPGPRSELEILVAEDHAVNRRLIGLLLEPISGRLTMVGNGAEAVAAAEGKAFDAILMDMQMPVMSGLEATRRIRDGRGPSAACPIIGLTANAFEENRQAWLAAGATAFLTKPIDADLLVATLAELV